MQLVTQYLGRVPKAETQVPRDIPKEPPQTKEKRVTLQQPWPLPAVVVAYHITYDGNPDSYPLHIAAKVLSDGESSRIYRKLVYEKQMALAAFGSANLIEDPNLFYAVAIVQPGHTPQEVADALIAELDRLKTEPMTDHELQRTKNQFARDYILGPRIESAEGAASGARRRHSQRHQDGRRRVRHLPEHHGRRRPARREDLFHAREPDGADDHAERSRPVTGTRRTPRWQGHQGRRRRSVPWRCSRRQDQRRCGTGRPKARRGRWRRATVKFPPYEIQTLPNGLQVVAVLHHEQPVVTHASAGARRRGARIRRSGSALARLAAALLDQGTTTQSAAEIARHDRLHRRRRWAPAPAPT